MKPKKSVSKPAAAPISEKAESANKRIMVQYVIDPKNSAGPKIKIVTEV